MPSGFKYENGQLIRDGKPASLDDLSSEMKLQVKLQKTAGNVVSKPDYTKQGAAEVNNESYERVKHMRSLLDQIATEKIGNPAAKK